MKINAENIEEWMFDFHEGMLSESDKAEVLNFLHTHPEFNAEFARWAQTHALKNDEIHVPADLLAGIVKPTTVPFYLNKFLLGTLTGIALTSGILGFLYMRNSTEKNKKETLTIEPTAVKSFNTTDQTSILPKKETIISAKPNTNNVSPRSLSHRTPTFSLNETQSEAKPEMETISRPDSVLTTDQEKLSPAFSLCETQSEVKQEKPNELEIAKTKEMASENKKKKRSLLPFSIKPQSKFKPANPNF